MSKLADNIKAGVKGIRGAGDVIRGEVLDTTDQLFDNPNHPTTAAAENKNRLTAEMGRQDIRNADETFAKHERESQSAAAASERAAHQPTGTAVNTGVSAPGAATTAPELPPRNVESTQATHSGEAAGSGIGHQSAPNTRY